GDSYLKLSTVLVFDIGVYLAVLGTLMTFVIGLMEVEG
ncbi:MAG: Na(+)/H(+) antiporter subunit B, partial [Pseudomonadota bacterium]|nr:Na(+)/H(+) antiporter subunit B [Pseudomonadota bacterium]